MIKESQLFYVHSSTQSFGGSPRLISGFNIWPTCIVYGWLFPPFNEIHTHLLFFLHLHITQNAMQLPFFFFILFLLLVSVFGRTAKSFLEVLGLFTKEVCDQDLAYFLDTQNNMSISMFLQVAIHDACGTWHSLFTVTSIHSIWKVQETPRNPEMCSETW